MDDLPPLVKVESVIKDLKLSLKGWFSHLKLFNRVNSPVDKRKVEIGTLNQIKEHQTFNAPVTILMVVDQAKAKELGENSIIHSIPYLSLNIPK